MRKNKHDRTNYENYLAGYAQYKAEKAKAKAEATAKDKAQDTAQNVAQADKDIR